jgi:hypothetical protein
MLSVGLAAAKFSPACASESEAPVQYTVRQGDTLIGIADRYLRLRGLYKIVQQHNRIANPTIIPIGKVIMIPRDLLKFKPAVAKLISVRGQVSAGDVTASAGQILQEGAVISTGASSFATMILEDGSRVSLPSNSDVRIRRLRSYTLGNSIDYDFDITRGGLRSAVAKQQSRDDRYQVRTPRAVSAVRGTDFQSRFDPATNSDFAEIVEGGLAMETKAGSQWSMPAGNGLAIKNDGAMLTEALLAPPDLVEPGKTQADKIVIFQAAEPVAVRFTIGSDSGFIEQIADVVAPDGQASIADLPNGNYFIRARAISGNDIQGMPATFAFKRRLNGVSATAGQSDEGYVFRWTGEGKAEQRFHFQLFRNATDILAIVDEAGLKNDRISISDLPPGDYFWRVGVVQYLDGEVAINWTPMEKLSVAGT